MEEVEMFNGSTYRHLKLHVQKYPHSQKKVTLM